MKGKRKWVRLVHPWEKWEVGKVRPQPLASPPPRELILVNATLQSGVWQTLASGAPSPLESPVLPTRWYLSLQGGFQGKASIQRPEFMGWGCSGGKGLEEGRLSDVEEIKDPSKALPVPPPVPHLCLHESRPTLLFCGA